MKNFDAIIIETPSQPAPGGAIQSRFAGCQVSEGSMHGHPVCNA
jgi:hypothetical protein